MSNDITPSEVYPGDFAPGTYLHRFADSFAALTPQDRAKVEMLIDALLDSGMSA